MQSGGSLVNVMGGEIQPLASLRDQATFCYYVLRLARSGAAAYQKVADSGPYESEDG